MTKHEINQIKQRIKLKRFELETVVLKSNI